MKSSARRNALWSTVVFCATVALSGCAAHQPAPPAPEPEASFDGKFVSDWSEALKSPDASTRVAAASALAKIGPRAKSAVPALIETLKDDHKLVRTQSIAALGKIGPAAVDAIPMLSRFAEDGDFAMRGVATAAIAAILGKPLPDDDAREKVPSRAKPRRSHGHSGTAAPPQTQPTPSAEPANVF